MAVRAFHRGRSWSGQYLGKYDCEFRSESSDVEPAESENTTSNFLVRLARRLLGWAPGQGTALPRSGKEGAKHEIVPLDGDEAAAAPDEHDVQSAAETAQNTVNGPDDMLR